MGGCGGGGQVALPRGASGQMAGGGQKPIRVVAAAPVADSREKI